MDCPHCGQQPSGPRVDDVTHNTLPANFYISTKTFLKQLEDAVNGAWSRRPDAYTQVTVLLLSWQESDMKNADLEIARLQSVLEDLYHYTVENWKIPSVKPRQEATFKYLQFAKDYGASGSLLIVYYAGHARATPGQGPIWHSRADGGYELDSTAILSQLATPADDGDDAPDILLIQDCCHPLSGYRSQGKPSTAVVECLYSGGFESRVPIAGPESFTAGLTNELGLAFNSRMPITVTELHSRLIRRFEAKQSSIVYDNQNAPRMRGDDLIMTKEDKITPSHTFLAPARPPRSIVLSPLHDPSQLQDDPVPSSDSRWPKVMIAVHLAENENAAEEVKQWLSTAPRGTVKFEAIIPSYSSILLVAIPVVLWDLLPPCSAVSFMGFIREPEDTKPTTQFPNDRYAIPVLGREKTQVPSFPWPPFSQETPLSRPLYSQVAWSPSPVTLKEARARQQPEGYKKQRLAAAKSKQITEPAKLRQDLLVDLLDLVDASWPGLYREWKSQDRSKASKSQDVLFDIFYRKVRDGVGWAIKVSEQMDVHQDIIGRLLSAYELLEENESAIPIRRRLIDKMKPHASAEANGSYVCPYTGCDAKAFKRKADLERHIRHVHKADEKRVDEGGVGPGHHIWSTMKDLDLAMLGETGFTRYEHEEVWDALRVPLPLDRRLASAELSSPGRTRSWEDEEPTPL